jgi:ABC-type dipeptide/oligopeptide/nickel transport system ATPase component
MTQPILTIRNLTVTLVDDPQHKIIDNVSLNVPPLSIVALVGGSGSGKSTTGFSVTRLLSPALAVRQGEIIFKGEDLLKADESRMRALRGREIGMVFQEPLHAFNPVYTVGWQIEEVLKVHTPLSREGIRKKTNELLTQVGLSDTARITGSYPHQLSGGMRQRAMVAQAIAASPSLLIADEPTSSLDVTLQAKVLELFVHLRDQFKLSILLITHDLGVVAHMADYVVVLERGKVVESGLTREIVGNPAHAYTKKLMGTLKD